MENKYKLEHNRRIAAEAWIEQLEEWEHSNQLKQWIQCKNALIVMEPGINMRFLNLRFWVNRDGKKKEML